MENKNKKISTSELLEKTINFVTLELKKNENQQTLTYHNLTHAKEVVETAHTISKEMGLSEESKNIVLISCWLHAIGYTEPIKETEKNSAERAKEFLAKNGAKEEDIEEIQNCILSTKPSSQKPQKLTEQIVSDAVYSDLGNRNYIQKKEHLRKEIEKKEHRTFTDIEWIKINIKTFNEHNYFTFYSTKNLDAIKKENLKALKKELKKNTKKNKQRTKHSDEHSMEIFYRTASRNHVTYSVNVDQKANIMIQTNSLIFSIIVSLLVRKLDQLPDLIIPTGVMLSTCVITIILAILATRPKIVNNTEESEEKIKSIKTLFPPLTQAQEVNSTKDKKNTITNLLNFGSFVKLPATQYKNEIKKMLKNETEYIDNMITDLYQLGVVVDKKYKFVKASYNVFMLGLIISIALYIYAFSQ